MLYVYFMFVVLNTGKHDYWSNIWGTFNRTASEYLWVL